VIEKTEELFNFENQPGFVEDLGNGHSVMVMIPELVDLEEDLMERPIQERFEDLAQALRDEGHQHFNWITRALFHKQVNPFFCWSKELFKRLNVFFK